MVLRPLPPPTRRPVNVKKQYVVSRSPTPSPRATGTRNSSPLSPAAVPLPFIPRLQTPTLFFYLSQPARKYILIPEVSSERRNYIPIGFISPAVISANTNFLVPSDSRFLFGVLTSAMHMAWVRQIGGRLESRYRYSGSMVYNNYPWPEKATAKQRTAVETAAQAMLDARAQYPTSTLADLYDPLTMSAPLLKAHQQLDRAVDRCYRPEPFPSDRHRVEYLFARYEQLTAPPGRRRQARP